MSKKLYQLSSSDLVLQPSDVVPVQDASLTKTIATVGGVEIKAPEGGGGGGGTAGHNLTVNARWLVAYAQYANAFEMAIFRADGTVAHEVVAGINGSKTLGPYENVTHVLFQFSTATSSAPGSWKIVSVNETQLNFGNTCGYQREMPHNHVTIPVAGDTTISIEIEDPTCLVEGTRITLADGTTKPIEDVTYDDDLLVWDFDRGERSHAKPAWVKIPEVAPYKYVSKFEDGTILETTGPRGHRVFDGEKFVYNTEAVGKDVWIDGRMVRMTSCERVEGSFRFYNVITARHCNVVANGVLTSCRLSNAYPIVGGKYVKPKDSGKTVCAVWSWAPRRIVDGLRLSEIGVDESYIRRIVGKDARQGRD